MTALITFLILSPVFALVIGLIWIGEHTTLLDRLANQPGMGWLHDWLNEPTA